MLGWQSPICTKKFHFNAHLLNFSLYTCGHNGKWNQIFTLTYINLISIILFFLFSRPTSTDFFIERPKIFLAPHRLEPTPNIWHGTFNFVKPWSNSID